MMKTDVLDDLADISVCTDYKSGNNTLSDYPFDLASENLAPVYQIMAGWKTPLENIRSYSELPSELITYIKYIEEYVEIPVEIISVGPDRNQTIRKAGL
jgi:adenylosuccinate synthase